MADYDYSTNAKTGSGGGIGLLVIAGVVVLVLLWAILAGGGASIDSTGRILVTLVDGRVMCFENAK
ncbi:MAG: hypothetical protein COB65_11290 [Thalassobium sp.]|nr:MAG: hypothetical protein COB65_11290 [Thalassobium sp.]